MKKIVYTTLFCLFVNVVAFAQAILPTSWSFTTATLPTGWYQSGTGFYSGSGNTPPAMKFDSTNDSLVVYFSGAPGDLTYYLTGNGFSGGTFDVKESQDGITYTVLHSHTSPPNATYTQFTDSPQANTRYILFVYTNKSAGNIGLDDVNIDAAPAGVDQEINVKFTGTTVLPGNTIAFNSAVGTPLVLNFDIENLGTNDVLNISNLTVTGPESADYTPSGYPTAVLAGTTGAFTISFNPSALGNRNAVLTIYSDDADEAVYNINLYGIGGNYATEPAAQPTALNFTNVKSYRLTGSFTSSTAEGFIVLRKKGSAITGVPADGTAYQRGDIVGDAQVVFAGNQSTFTPNNIVASTDYYFAVFAYNGTGIYTNYLTTSPLTGNVTSLGSMQPGGYYSGINTGSATFVTDLHNLVNPHQMQFYSNYNTLMIGRFASRDTTLNRRVVTCVYSGENKIYTEPFDFTSNNFSREHTYCHSWMPTNPANSLPEYNDYHHLFPTNQNNANALRSNYPLGEVVTAQFTYLGCKFGQDANGKDVFEPRDEHKGDAARAMMYEAICYTTVSGNNWGFPNPISGTINYGQDQAILKQWNFADLPDSWEISRNDFLDSLQGNRNPFVDNPNYACFINFTNVSYEALGCQAEIDEALLKGFMVYPNPSTSTILLSVDATKILGYEIISTDGKVVRSSEVNNEVVVHAKIDDLQKGSYLVKVKTPYGTVQKQFIKN